MRIVKRMGFRPYVILADMVRDPGEYRWSSYRWHGLGAENELITDHPLYTALGPDETVR